MVVRAGALLLAVLLGAEDASAAKAKGAGGFEGVGCPAGFELQDNGACLRPVEDEDPIAPPLDLLEAAERGDELAAAAFMLDGADPKMRNGRGQTPLHLAARHGHDRVIGRVLLYDSGSEHGIAAIDAVDDEGQQPLHLTVPNGFFDTFTLLVEHGADPNAPIGQSGSTLLHFAAFSGTPEAVAYLLENGCSADSADKDGARPIHAAAYAGKNDIIATLSEHGADPNVQDKKGTTALHLTAQQKHIYVCRALLKLGADPALPDNSGATAVSVAVHTNSGAVLAELLAAMSTRKVNKEMKRTFGPHEETLLHYAAKEGHVDVLKTLVKQKNIELDAITQQGDTALVLAARTHLGYKAAKVKAGADATLGDLRAACDQADIDLPQGTQWGRVKKLLSLEVLAKLEAAPPPPPPPPRLSEEDEAVELAALEEELVGAKLSAGANIAIMQKAGVSSVAALLGEGEGLAAKLKLKLGDKKRLQELLREWRRRLGTDTAAAAAAGKQDL